MHVHILQYYDLVYLVIYTFKKNILLKKNAIMFFFLKKTFFLNKLEQKKNVFFLQH